MPSDYYRFLLSGSRNRFLSTDLQSAFWKRLGKEPSLGFPMDLTNLHALLNDQKAGSHSELTSHQLALRLPHPRQQHLTDGLGSYELECQPVWLIYLEARFAEVRPDYRAAEILVRHIR